MTEFRTVKRNGKTQRIPISKSHGSSKFIQKSIKHPGRVRGYIERTYGKEGFNEDGTLKVEYLEKAKKKAEESGNRSLVDAIDLALRLKKIDKNKDPYGESKPEASEQARKLRDEGERVRVIETNKKKDLYAPFVGDLKTGKVIEPAKESAKQKLTYSKALENMKPVPIELRIEGEPRKGSIYAAVITGTDPKYGLKREFLKGDKTYTGKHDVTVDYSASLKPGTIIETGEGGSWNNKYGNYYIVTDKGLRKLSSNYNGEGKLTVKDLVKAREKALPR